jgi:hypothetical protein
MDDPTPRMLLDRNPVTHARHRRETLTQITLPFAASVILILGLVALVIWMGTAGEHSQWADVSLIWLLIPVMFVSFLFLLILAGITYGLIWVIGILPHYSKRVQDFFSLIRVRVAHLDNRMVEPILGIQGMTASMRALIRALGRR